MTDSCDHKRRVALASITRSLSRAHTYANMSARFAARGNHATAERLLKQAWTRLRTCETKLARVAPVDDEPRQLRLDV